MTEQLKDIGNRLAALRSIAELSPEGFCEKTGVSKDELAAYEKGERDFSFSFLYNAARVLNVDVVDLMSGDSPRLSHWFVARKGEGYAIDRYAAYKYLHLAFTFKDKKMEPFMVTAEPKPDPPALHKHEGQEFMWVVQGKLRFHISDVTYDMEPGDSAYFNSSIPHAVEALEGAPAQFIAVVAG